MINAKEARKYLNDQINKNINDHLNSIESKVKDSIANLNSEVYYYDRVPHEVIEALKSLGYSVEESDSQRDGYILHITF